MIKFSILGSGSKGNAIFINIDGRNILIDCGFTKKEMNSRLSTLGRSMDDIDFIFITHNHKDHYAAWLQKDSARKVFTKTRPQEFSFIKSFLLSHDSEHGSVGYIIRDEIGNRVVVIMDTGCIPEEVLPNMFDCQAILIETNYDVDMLINSPYPTELQERIASNTGHLRAECAAEVVGMVAWPGLKYVCALHLSSTCINPVLARFELESVVDKKTCEVVISEQGKVSKMMTVM